MSLEHDQQLSEQVLVVVQPHLPLLALSQNRRERWPAQRTRCGHERFSSGNTTSKSAPGGIGHLWQGKGGDSDAGRAAVAASTVANHQRFSRHNAELLQ